MFIYGVAGKGSEWAKICLYEIERKSETGEGKSKWERERKVYMKERRIKQRKIKEEGRDQIWERIKWKERRRQREEGEKKTRE